MRLLFFGSPPAAVPFLETCLASGHEVAAVVTQTDKPAGRGLETAPCAVARFAEGRGLRLLKPPKPSERAGELKALGADMAVVVAYGKLLKTDVLAATRLGFLNVHFSLLPRCRGAAPVAWTLIRGETSSGVTLFWLDEGMDSGPVQSRASLPVGPDEDAASLMARLSELGRARLGSALAAVAAGEIVKEPQSGEPSLAPKLRPEQARLDFMRPARELHNWVRGLSLGPKAHVFLAGPRGPARVALLETEAAQEEPLPQGEPGTLLSVDARRGFLVQCRPGCLWVRRVQPEGKNPLSAADWLNGLRLRSGGRLEALPPPGAL